MLSLLILTIKLSCITIQDDPNRKKITANSPSNAKVMPEDYLPTHFLSWLANGPAAEDQHPLWLPDTGKPMINKKADILDCPTASTSLGKTSQYSRKMQRLEGMRNSNGPVLDLTQDEVSNGLLRQSVNNGAQLVSLLKGANDQERQYVDALVQNAQKMYDLVSTNENKAAFITALQRQKDLLMSRSIKPSVVKEEAVVQEECEEEFNESYLFDGSHSLDDSFTHESVDPVIPTSL
jgi:hypothetical protein